MSDPDAAVAEARQALDAAKARRLMLEAVDPRRLADREVERSHQELAAAEHEQRVQHYWERKSEAEAWIREYAKQAAAFDAKLDELAAVVERMSLLTAQIEGTRSVLTRESRAVGDWGPVLTFASRAWRRDIEAVLRRAWARGQVASAAPM